MADRFDGTVENDTSEVGGTARGLRRNHVTFAVEHEDRSNSIHRPIFSGRTVQREPDETSNSSAKGNYVLLGLKIIIGIVFFIIVLVSNVMNKLTLVSLTSSLHHVTWQVQNCTKTKLSDCDKDLNMAETRNSAVPIYWQLLLILLVPNCVTFLRCLFLGFLGKTQKSFPWPQGRSIVLGLLSSLVEVLGMSVFVFLVLVELDPGVAILALNGVFIFQIILDVQGSFKKSCGTDKCQPARRREYGDIADCGSQEQPLINDGDQEDVQSRIKTCLRWCEKKNEHWFLKCLALLLQGAGLIGLIGFWGSQVGHHNFPLDVHLRPMIGLPLVIIAMSIIWSDRVQRFFARAHGKTVDENKKSARYKSSLINSAFRIFLYPFVTYVIFRYATPFRNQIDPWCVSHDCTVHITGPTLNTMIVHIVLSFVGYIFVWISCTMTLSQISVGIPLLLSTPISLGIYYIVAYAGIKNSDKFFPPFSSKDSEKFVFDTLAPIPISALIALLLWLGELVAMGFFILTKTNIILAKDGDMFLTPHYDSIFLEQHTILNRQVKKTQLGSFIFPRQRKPRMIFICSTMYHENDVEMKQMLTSILRVAQRYEKDNKLQMNSDKFESHIFFDGAINVNQIENFGLQLLSLLEDTLKVKLRCAIKTRTPYGYRLRWKLGVTESVMPFCIHFKDKNLVKPKKRWSQVMYMNYVINYRIEEDNLDADDTFILTTDADIDFTADSAIVLLDMLETNPNVAAVSARTHPKGSGLVYWYQLYDYAIGHWFQKPAEHILGSVLCSPGCFSVFRCSSLKLVLEEYSTDANSASEFLMKDMGEDRWLCTLLIKKGLRLEYCAISEDQTYCPTEFDEFFKQRRRWIPSTVANLITLISESGIITRGNDSISIPYILFQAVMVFSTSISPATVILVIAAGLENFDVPIEFSIPFFFFVGIIYGLICLFASPQAQLDVAKILTFLFAIVMALVIIGIVKDIVDGLIGQPDKLFIGPPDCSQLMNGKNKTKEYEDCMKGHNFASHVNNSRYHVFELPVAASTVYIGVLAATFTLAGVFHLPEMYCLMHSIWGLLALPSTYLLLLIYSAANLCDRSWGTRELNTGTDEGIWGWRRYIIRAWKKLTSLWCCVKCCKGGGGGGGGEGGEKGEGGGGKDDVKKKKDEGKEEGEGAEGGKTDGGGEGEKKGDKEATAHQRTPPGVEVEHVGMNESAVEWLCEQECENYLENFVEHGYTNKFFIATMSPEDFEAIGIDKQGFRLRLVRAAKQLPHLPFQTSPPRDVREWLEYLQLEEYTEIFHQEGYKFDSDLENMKALDERQLRAIGVKKRAHLQRLLEALGHLSHPPVMIEHPQMDDRTKEWLREYECEHYIENFCENGYTNRHFIAGMKSKDLVAIGVEKKGLRLRLEKAAQLLPSLPIQVNVPDDVESWLHVLELSEYEELFYREGYKKAEDIINLKELDRAQLVAMGITKRAHLNRLEVALGNLAKPSMVELNKRRTKGIIDNVEMVALEEVDKPEYDFWVQLVHHKLKPISQKFTQIKDVQKSLESLRNSAMAFMLLINLMWIVLLMSLSFTQLQTYNIDPKAFQLIFLAVYGLIMLIQFITMLAHRAVTLIHYLGRVNPTKVMVTPWSDAHIDFELVSVNEQRSEEA